MIARATALAALTAILVPMCAYGESDRRDAITSAWAASESEMTISLADEGSYGYRGLAALITEALENNPEILAAQREYAAARQRIAPAAALDDPMLEAGVINAPLASSPFNREDMTMKMIGLSQRFPFPGKLGLRKGVASKDAEAIDYGYQETINRVVRDLKVAYFDLGLTLEITRLVEKNKLILEDFTHLAVDHYAAGMGNQVRIDADSTKHRHGSQLQIFAISTHTFLHLRGQFARWCQDQRPNGRTACRRSRRGAIR